MMLGVFLLILFVPYLIWNTLLAWFASRVMVFRYGTVGNALKLGLLQLLLPIPVGILVAIGVLVAAPLLVSVPEDTAVALVICAAAGGLVVALLFSVFITSRL